MSRKQFNKGVKELVKHFGKDVAGRRNRGVRPDKTSLISIVFALTVLGVSATLKALTLLQNFDEREDHQPIKVTIAC